MFNLRLQNDEEGSKGDKSDGDSGYIKLKVLGNVSTVI